MKKKKWNVINKIKIRPIKNLFIPFSMVKSLALVSQFGWQTFRITDEELAHELFWFLCIFKAVVSGVKRLFGYDSVIDGSTTGDMELAEMSAAGALGGASEGAREDSDPHDHTFTPSTENPLHSRGQQGASNSRKAGTPLPPPAPGVGGTSISRDAIKESQAPSMSMVSLVDAEMASGGDGLMMENPMHGRGSNTTGANTNNTNVAVPPGASPATTPKKKKSFVQRISHKIDKLR